MAYARAGRQGYNFRMLINGLTITAALVVGPVLATSAGARSTDAGSHLRGSGKSTQDVAVQVGSDAPDVELESIDGDSLRLSDLEGEKNVILVFFRGTW